ncbi:MAG: HD domain-containing protein [Dehalococcoidia bacterium]
MKEDTLQRLGTWFDNYVAGFKSTDSTLNQAINLKEEHTRRVCREILHIARSLELNDEIVQLAETAALFHDIGRFEQYRRYRTFSDMASVNHAELGITVLKEKRVLHILSKSDQNIILRAINYHNRMKLPDSENERCLLLGKLLRDADKLDIWNVMLSSYERDNGERDEALELGLPDTPGFSEQIYVDLRSGAIAEMQNVVNRNDLKLLQLGWVYDINFKPSFIRIRERKYLERFRGVLPASREIDDLINLIDKHLLAQTETR